MAHRRFFSLLLHEANHIAPKEAAESLSLRNFAKNLLPEPQKRVFCNGACANCVCGKNIVKCALKLK